MHLEKNVLTLSLHARSGTRQKAVQYRVCEGELESSQFGRKVAYLLYAQKRRPGYLDVVAAHDSIEISPGSMGHPQHQPKIIHVREHGINLHSNTGI